MSNLKDMAVDHPYYCSESNYYSNEASQKYETMTEYLDDWEECDIDMNLIFRWDIKLRGEGEEAAKAGRYYAEVFYILQRKGIFKPIYIAHVNEVEVDRFKILANKHWAAMQELWAPIAPLTDGDE